MNSLASRVCRTVSNSVVILAIYLAITSTAPPARAAQNEIGARTIVPPLSPSQTHQITMTPDADGTQSLPFTRSAPAPQSIAIPQNETSPKLPQTAVDEIVGPAATDTISSALPNGTWPPDIMGAVGPLQFLFTVNGRFRAYTKTVPHTVVLDASDLAFWGTYADPSGVSDPHVRYDRATQRWFITEIDERSTDNHLLLAVSTTADLSTTAWLKYTLALTDATRQQPTYEDNNCRGDYDTLGIDQNAIYVAINIIGTGQGNCLDSGYLHSNALVITKTSALAGQVSYGLMLEVTYQMPNSHGIPYSPQVVDSYDSLQSAYLIWTDKAEFPIAHLDIFQITNPATNPGYGGTIQPEMQIYPLPSIQRHNHIPSSAIGQARASIRSVSLIRVTA